MLQDINDKETSISTDGMTVGIDYRHPAFGGGFGEGYKVRYGYDLVGNRFNSKDPTSIRQENTPLDTCVGGNGKVDRIKPVCFSNCLVTMFISRPRYSCSWYYCC